MEVANYDTLARIQCERDWDAALIEQGLREAVYVVDTLVYLSQLTKDQKSQLWAYRQKWVRTLGLDKEI